jgi:hypothetical protein
MCGLVVSSSVLLEWSVQEAPEVKHALLGMSGN